jgi:hypothetical protein
MKSEPAHPSVAHWNQFRPALRANKAKQNAVVAENNHGIIRIKVIGNY